MKRNFKGQEIYGKWTLLKSIDSGGNGDVWLATDGKDKVALKLSKKDGDIPNQRFKDEVEAICKCKDIVGVIDVLDSYLPTDHKTETAYFAMPIGEPITKTIQEIQGVDLHSEMNGANMSIFKDRISLITKLSTSLVEIHERAIYHRDIKPSNIVIIDKMPVFIDFGLATFPNKKKVSKINEKIGPFSTMPPEINRRTGQLNFEKADVYSFAKTCWMILTGNYIGFEGQYSHNSTIALNRYFLNSYTTPFDELLRIATSNDINSRPTIKEFNQKLIDWKNAVENFHNYNRSQWKEFIDSMFPVSIPKRVEWKEINEIVKILKELSSTKSMNHTFLPISGGFDLRGAKLAIEDGLIELDFGVTYILKPSRLMFESFDANYEWFYFRLEVATINETGLGTYLRKDSTFEDLSEISPGEYREDSYLRDWYDREEEEEFPIESRRITRVLKGTLVIFNKRSAYNLDGKTYDGRHNKMDADSFRSYIEKSLLSH